LLFDWQFFKLCRAQKKLPAYGAKLLFFAMARKTVFKMASDFFGSGSSFILRAVAFGVLENPQTEIVGHTN
jgi:hypothetical protein